jgi:hypothetical protein
MGEIAVNQQSGPSGTLGQYESVPIAPDDSACVARKLARDFGDLVKYYQEQYKLSYREAYDRAAEPFPLERMMNVSEDQVMWGELRSLADNDPEQAKQRWEQIKKAARDELQTGWHAAKLLDDSSATCWSRAKFLALRTELREAWRPHNAQEAHLIDQMATYQTLTERWQEFLVALTSVMSIRSRKRKTELGEIPRVSDVEAIREATCLIERFQKLYHLALRALQNQRRIRRSRTITRTNQVNIGHGLQVNITSLSDE